MTSTLFIPGYTLRDAPVNGAQVTVSVAAARVEGVSHYSLAYPIREIGSEKVLPPFPDMVTLAKEAAREYRPSVIIGHCVGAAVAFDLLQKREKEGEPIKAILLCPPVELMSNVNLQNPKFRMFGVSLGISKIPFRSADFSSAVLCRAGTIIEAAKVFSNLWAAEADFEKRDDLIFVSAQHDKLCNPSAIGQLAEKMHSPHINLNDNHSVKRPPSITIIQSLIEAFLEQGAPARSRTPAPPEVQPPLSHWPVAAS